MHKNISALVNMSCEVIGTRRPTVTHTSEVEHPIEAAVEEVAVSVAEPIEELGVGWSWQRRGFGKCQLVSTTSDTALVDIWSLCHIALGGFGFLAFGGSGDDGINPIGLPILLLLHTLLEIVENSPWGIRLVKYIWPVSQGDTILNSLGDTLMCVAGWYIYDWSAVSNASMISLYIMLFLIPFLVTSWRIRLQRRGGATA